MCKENEKIKHLEFIESIINRFNHDSFLIKGWMITLVSALLVLAVNSTEYKMFLVAIFPVVVFCFLDAFYLQEERKFVELYKQTAQGNVKDFSMDVTTYKNVIRCKYSHVLFSKTIFPLYFSIIMMLGSIYIWFQQCTCFLIVFILSYIVIILCWYQNRNL
jgi:hypothetical protein